VNVKEVKLGVSVLVDDGSPRKVSGKQCGGEVSEDSLVSDDGEEESVRELLATFISLPSGDNRRCQCYKQLMTALTLNTLLRHIVLDSCYAHDTRPIDPLPFRCRPNVVIPVSGKTLTKLPNTEYEASNISQYRFKHSYPNTPTPSLPFH
jgi:hypothetical protein